MTQLSGYGMAVSAPAYLYRPGNVEAAAKVFDLARRSGHQVVLRGAGRSYGDAALAAEAVALDITRMSSVLNWDPESGVLEAEGGLTIEGIWRRCLEDGWWPPVVSGTMAPTLAGALSMNIHGKNNYRVGTFGDHVLEIDLLTPKGEVVTLTPQDSRFFAVVGGLGLLGAIVRVKLQLKKVASGDLKVMPANADNWAGQFSLFDEFEADADYMVTWVDLFGRGKRSGRGAFHAAWYSNVEDPASLRAEHQDLPDSIMGLVPKSMVWRLLKVLNHRAGMRLTNWAKQTASSHLGDRKMSDQSLVGFSFLLDYVPNWRNAYLPGGFIQYQSFIPKDKALTVFAEQAEMQRAVGLESFLGVMKRHRPDPFLFTHAVDGYSLALDFKVTRRNRERLFGLCHRMNEVVLAAGGRFYLAKDSTLRPDEARAYLGDEALSRFRRLKAEFDPEGMITSGLARRLKLV